MTLIRPLDAETVRAIATALADQLDEPVELVADGETIASGGESARAPGADAEYAR